MAQAVEHYNNGIIFYSLGNFIFPPTNEHQRSTFAPTIKLSKNGLEDVVLFPVKPVNGKPYAMDTAEAEDFFNFLQEWKLNI